MNVYDSGRMADVLAPEGWRITQKPNEADMVLINTCHIREKAEEKLFSELGRWAAVKKSRREKDKKLLLAVAGCVAQAEGDAIIDRQSAVDIVVGPGSYHRLAELAKRAETKTAETATVALDFPPIPKFDHLPKPQSRGVSAYLSVQEGCDKFCSFCVVPYTRGAEYSRPLPQVLEEARHLVARGAKEITLLGQNVNAYHGEWGRGSCDLGTLIFKLAELDGLKRIRYTTSHPRDMHDQLYRAHGEVPQLMPFLHLPPQSGSDRILALMNRRHTVDDYRRIAHRLFEHRPDIALSGDFIVAFPGEEEDDFEKTMELAEELPFAHSYSFIYSPRPGTPAAAMEGAIPEPIAKERLARLQTLLARKRREFNLSFVNSCLPVLVEENHETNGALGKTPYRQRVRLGHSPAAGNEVKVSLTDFKNGAFYGIVENEERVFA